MIVFQDMKTGERVYSPVCSRGNRQYAMKKARQRDLFKVGCLGGRLIFHPWRMKDYMWENGPHFHGIPIGFPDTARLGDQEGPFQGPTAVRQADHGLSSHP